MSEELSESSPPEIIDETREAVPVEEHTPGIPTLRVKTLIELRQDTSSWCLLSDSELQQYLKQYSTELLAKTKQIQDSLNEVIDASNSARVKLNNAFNQFLMLSNTQFIENRVYEEDEQIAEQDKDTATMEEGKEEEEKPASAATLVVNKYRSALDMGLQAMKLFAMIEDETEEVPEEEYDALDIYNERPLPFIIGTRDFLEDDTLGLGAAPESEESESEKGSSESERSGSSRSSESERSISDSEYSEEETESRGRPTRKQSMDSRVSSRRSNSSEEWSDEEDRRSKASSHRSSRSRSRSKSRERPPPGLPPPPIPVQDYDSDSGAENLFAPTPKSSRQVGPHTPSAASASIMWSDDEDDDLFSYRPSTLDQKMKKQESYAGLFEDEDGSDSGRSRSNAPAADLFAAEDMGEGLFSAPTTTAQPRTPSRLSSNSKLFDGESDEESENGLFGGVSGKPSESDLRSSMLPVPSLPQRDASTRSGLFDAESDDGGASSALFEDSHSQAPISRATSIRSATSNRKGLFGDDSDNESTVSGLFGVSSTPKRASQAKSSTSGIFGEEDTNSSKIPTPKKTSAGLFGEDSEEEEGLFAKSSVPTPKRAHSGLFGEEDDDDSEVFAQSKAPTPKPTPISAQHSSPGLFGEDEEEESEGLFAKASVPTPKTTQPSSTGLFGEEEKDSDDLFSKSTEPTFQATTKSSSGLFGEEDDDESELFGNPTPKAAPLATQPSSTGLFEADNSSALSNQTNRKSVYSDTKKSSLFGDDSDNESTVSGLFGRSESKKSLPAANAVPLPIVPSLSKQTSVVESVAESEGGLFGSASTLSPPKPISRTTTKQSDWDDDDSDGGLFGASPVPAAEEGLFGRSSAIERPIPTPPAMNLTSAQSMDGSDDDWEDDSDAGLFGSATTATTTTTTTTTIEKKPSGLIASTSAESSLFGETETKSTKLFETTESKPINNPLFGDSKPAIPVPMAAIQPPRDDGFSDSDIDWDDDDSLFGTSKK